MTKSCSVWGCTSRLKRGQNKHFFRFPAINTRSRQRKAWIKALRRSQGPITKRSTAGSISYSYKPWYPGKWAYVCRKHFVSGKPHRGQDVSHPDYAPSLFLTNDKSSPTFSKKKIERYERYMNRTNRGGNNPHAFDTANNLVNSCDGEKVNEEVSDINSLRLKEELAKVKEHCCMLEKEVEALRLEKDMLKKKLEACQFTYEKLSKQDMRFYTGLPNLGVFLWILQLVASYVTERKVVSIGNQILLSLMKLRHGLKNKDLANRFGVAASTVSDILNECIPVLATRLRFVIEWPTNQILQRNLPEKFKKKYNRCCVIIDCTEFFIDRPYNLTSRAQTWSNYKHHHTLKALIGITPYGSISFVSRLWGGRISDKEITERSGFYSYIRPGDQVMADRGFTISQELARHGAHLILPPFTKGKKQLSGKTVQHARQISSLRIHVERAMERIKNFDILKNTLPVTLLPLSSDIVTVCAALNNLLPKLVK